MKVRFWFNLPFYKFWSVKNGSLHLFQEYGIVLIFFILFVLKGKRICIKESSSDKLILHPWSIQRFSLSTYYLGIVQCYNQSILYSRICLKYYYFENIIIEKIIKMRSAFSVLKSLAQWMV